MRENLENQGKTGVKIKSVKTGVLGKLGKTKRETRKTKIKSREKSGKPQKLVKISMKIRKAHRKNGGKLEKKLGKTTIKQKQNHKKLRKVENRRNLGK